MVKGCVPCLGSPGDGAKLAGLHKHQCCTLQCEREGPSQIHITSMVLAARQRKWLGLHPACKEHRRKKCPNQTASGYVFSRRLAHFLFQHSGVTVVVIVWLCCLNFKCNYVTEEYHENRDLHQTAPVNTTFDLHLCCNENEYPIIHLQSIGL